MKWGGAVVSVLLVVVWIGSGWWRVQWTSTAGYQASIGTGEIRVHYWGASARGVQYGFYSSMAIPAKWDWWLQTWSGPFGWQVAMPLCYPAGATALVTAIAWRLDTLARRRARTGFCPKCIYNRTGLAAGAVCPECGAAAIVPPLLPTSPAS